MSYLSDATVLSVRPVTIDGSQSGVGAGVGAIAGGVAAANAASYIRLGLAGLARRRGRRRARQRDGAQRDQQNGVELLLQMRNGERRSIVQANGNEGWTIGEPVVLVTTGGRTRVTRAPQVGAQPCRRPIPRRGYPAPQAMPAPVPVYPQSGPVPPAASPPLSPARGRSASPSVSTSVSPDLRPRRPARLDVALVHLELDADVGLGRIAAPHHLADAVAGAEVGIVAAQPEGRVAARAARRSRRWRTRPRPAAAGRRACRCRRCGPCRAARA